MTALLTAPAVLPKAPLDQLFLEARTHNAWLDEPVSDETLRELYDLVKWGPTAVNGSPLRVVFVRSADSKARLLATVSPGNVAKVQAAPVTAILAQDIEFYEKLPTLFPHADLKPMFASKPEMARETAFRNSSMQGGYFIVAARALGLDCGPMSGFDNPALDAAFFKGTSWRSNFICNLGYGDASKLHPRAPRLDFDEACRIL